MDLDDSFTEKLLQRKKAQKEFLKIKKAESPNLVSKKRGALVEEQQITNGDSVPEDSPKRQCMENPSEKGKENVLVDEKESQESLASNACGLKAFRKNGTNVDGIISIQPAKEIKVNKPKTYLFSTNSSDLCFERRTRFADLASRINQFEDDVHQHTMLPNSPPSNKSSFVAQHLGSVSSSECSSKKSNVVCNNRQTDFLDQAVSIPMQNEDNPKYPAKPVEISEKSEKYNNKKGDNDCFPNNDFRSVLKKGGRQNLKKIEATNSVLDKNFDPVDLPLSARKALFENGVVSGNKQTTAFLGPKLSVAQRAALWENGSVQSNPKAAVKFGGFKQQMTASPTKTAVQPVVNLANSLPKVETPKVAITVSKEHTPSPPTEQSLSLEPVRKKIVIGNLVNHWEKISSSSSLGHSNSEEEVCLKHNDKIEKRSEECESELESEYNEQESESEGNEREFESEQESDSEDEGSEVPACNEELKNNISDHEDPFMDHDDFNPKMFSTEAGLSNYDTDSVTATDDETGHHWQQHDNQVADTPSMQSSISESSSYNISKSQTCSSVSSAESYDGADSQEQSRIRAREFSKGSSSSCESPLMYTVSFYRKQKQETRTPPLQTIVRREHVLSPTEEEELAQTENIQERIKMLQEEILRQQTVIGQTSQALNLCHATAEFSGSSEQVEGERLLLIATQKRQACLNEIQRLKSHGATGENVSDGTGTLTITDIQLPLKREFIASQLEGKLNDAVHCFLCLIRHGAQVIVTQMVSTSDKIADGALCFTNHIKLQKLPPDFSVVFEVYALQTKKENLPHEKKYHIKRDHNKNRKGKKNDGKLMLPAIISPGGPSAVRSSSFGVIGYTRFNIQNYTKRCFTLDKVPFTSPLDGVLKVKLHLHAEHKVTEKGFLTMFEDVSGFGAWHRRWCTLDSHLLSYWRYPDEEQKKEPINTIDLNQCVTGEVKLVARDVCARPHTFQLVIVRPQEKGDKNTLITRSINTLTTTRHLLSADTKEERILWCKKLNEALTNARKWDARALRPIVNKKEETTL